MICANCGYGIKDHHLANYYNGPMQGSDILVCPSNVFKECDHDWVQSPIDCPDGKKGCLVAHFGQVCRYCGVQKKNKK